MEDNSLHRGELSFWEAIALSIAIMAPTAAMALNGSLAAGVTGASVPLAFLAAAIVVGLVSFSFIQFTRHFAHSGSVYAFNGIALGPRVGFFSGWALLGTYVAFTGASIAEVGNFAQAFFASISTNIDWFPLALIAGILVWFLAYSDIALSTRLALVLEGISILLISILAVIILAKVGGQGHLSATPFTFAGNPLNAIGLAAVFGFLSFAGFEGAATLGEETRNPRRNIPLAILGAVVFSGILYVIITYAQTVGFGLSPAGLKAFAASTSPLGDLGHRYVGRVMEVAINAGATISAFASALGAANAASRVLFSMGRDGFIDDRLGETSPRTGSPWISLAIVMVIALAIDIVWGRFPGTNGAALFGYLGTIGVFLLLIAYGLTNVGAMRFFMSRHLWTWQWIIPILALAALGYTLYSNIYPVPAAPYNAFPYVALVWLLVGLIIVFVSPALVRRVGEHLRDSEGLSVEEQTGTAAAGE